MVAHDVLERNLTKERLSMIVESDQQPLYLPSLTSNIQITLKNKKARKKSIKFKKCSPQRPTVILSFHQSYKDE